MRKLLNIIIIFFIISFVLWGMLNVNIINTESLSKSSGDKTSISKEDYKELQDEFGQDFLGLLEDDCGIKIHDESGSYTLELNGEYYNINGIGSRLESIGMVKQNDNSLISKVEHGMEYFYEEIAKKISSII